ncbi:ArdC-like ssDNA-binding domain-containing protein [Candidatus Cyanaurora vandensis]|uniref:ArdC-like ssDNA-binding domain-containing protein n=1 Tax=Candidatus Cyanaurora vandensis TaxID=2714958 RepID=UPI00257B09EF|nr:ArdC-like ssDNA-binding domain-containing protein [Candidatus Cyanaurora vandensis]
MDKTDKTAIAFDRLAAGLQELLTAGKWLDYLKFQARFHSYSFTNSILLQAQMPTATQVAGFHAWKKLGRSLTYSPS